MPKAHPRPWHRGSTFGEGPRQPLDRERRNTWRVRIELHRRAKRLTGDQSYVALALLRHLGTDGRCDPDHQTLAAASGQGLGCVKEALKRLASCGMLSWARRLVREGNRVRQTSNAYLLTLGDAPQIPAVRCEITTRRGIIKLDIDTVHHPALAVPRGTAGPIGAAGIMARVRAKLLGRG